MRRLHAALAASRQALAASRQPPASLEEQQVKHVKQVKQQAPLPTPPLAKSGGGAEELVASPDSEGYLLLVARAEAAGCGGGGVGRGGRGSGEGGEGEALRLYKEALRSGGEAVRRRKQACGADASAHAHAHASDDSSPSSAAGAYVWALCSYAAFAQQHVTLAPAASELALQVR